MVVVCSRAPGVSTDLGLGPGFPKSQTIPLSGWVSFHNSFNPGPVRGHGVSFSGYQ